MAPQGRATGEGPEAGSPPGSTDPEERAAPPTGEDGGRISRRRFVVRSGLGLAGAGLAGALGVELAQDGRRPEFDVRAPTGQLAPLERETIVALLEVVVSPAYLESRSTLASFVDSLTESRAGVLAEYRAGAALLDDQAHDRLGVRRFAKASVGARSALLEAMLWRYPAERGSELSDYRVKLQRRLERAIHSERVARFRELVVRDLLAQYHTRFAWRLTGYSNHPGVPGGPLAYVEPPASIAGASTLASGPGDPPRTVRRRRSPRLGS